VRRQVHTVFQSSVRFAQLDEFVCFVVWSLSLQNVGPGFIPHGIPWQNVKFFMEISWDDGIPCDVVFRGNSMTYFI